MRPDALRTETGDVAAAAARARAGERDGFRELVELSSPRIYRLALRVLGDPDEADDVVQETYVRAWGRMEELRDPSAAMGWLSRIARNAARDRLRWWKRRPRVSFDETAMPLARAVEHVSEPPADEALASAEMSAAVAAAVAGLPDKHRVVLLLREADGMTYEEIADSLDIAVGTVESRLHRARAALARRLQKLVKEEAR